MRQKAYSPPLEVLSPEAELGLDDLYYFGREIWGLTLLRDKPHREMADDLMAIYRGTEGKRFLLNSVPRDCFKTTFGSVCFAAWVQLNEIYRKKNYTYRIFVTSATLEGSQTIITKIMEKFQYDSVLRETYGDLYGKTVTVNSSFVGFNLSPRMATGHVAIMAEPNFFCGSEVSEKTGKHSDMNIVDDLSNEKNSRTAKAREKVKNAHKNGFSILDKERGIEVMNCTSWHDDDVKGEIIRREKKLVEEQGEAASMWIVRSHGAVNEDGSLYFPDRLSMDVLEALRIELGPYIFAAQYENDPSKVGHLVQPDQIRFRDPGSFPEFKKYRITVDPAYGDEERDNGDFYWISVAGYDQFNTMYVLDVRYGTDWNPSGLVDRLFSVAKDYADEANGEAPQILFEAEHGSVFRQLIGFEEQKRGYDLRVKFFVRERTRDGDKWSRWIKLQPRFENGRIFFSSALTLAAQSEIKEQLLRAPNGNHDDFLDTLADMETGMPMKDDPNASVEAVERKKQLTRVVKKMRSTYDPVTRRFEGKEVEVEEKIPSFSFDDLMKKKDGILQEW